MNIKKLRKGGRERERITEREGSRLGCGRAIRVRENEHVIERYTQSRREVDRRSADMRRE